jgi:hypothetical protein
MGNNINQALIEAIIDKKGLEFIKNLVAQGADINSVHGDIIYTSKSVLNLAAESGEVEIVKYFMEQHAKPFTDKYFINYKEQFRESVYQDLEHIGNNLINSACHSGSIELVQWLLDNGEQSSEIELWAAVASEKLELVKWLTEEKGIVIHKNIISSAIPNREMVDWLFEHGAQVDEDGFDIFEAASFGDLELVQLLYAKGGKLTNAAKDTALKSGNNELIKWLESQKIDSPLFNDAIEKAQLIDLHDEVAMNPTYQISYVIPSVYAEQKEYAIYYLIDTFGSLKKLLGSKDSLDNNETRAFLNALNFQANNNEVIAVLLDERFLENYVRDLFPRVRYDIIEDDGLPTIINQLKILTANAIKANIILKKTAGETLNLDEVNQLNYPVLWPVWNNNCLDLDIKCISYQIYIPEHDKSKYDGGSFEIRGQAFLESISNNGIMRFRSDLYVKGNQVTVEHERGLLIVGHNMFLSVSKLSITDGGKIQSGKNMYLFNVENLECINGKINADGDLYLPMKDHLHLDNCNIAAKSITYIDDEVKDTICNVQSFANSELLQKYCELSGVVEGYDEHQCGGYFMIS